MLVVGQLPCLSHPFPGLDVVSHIFTDAGAFPSVPEENSQRCMQLCYFFSYNLFMLSLCPHGLTTSFGKSDSKMKPLQAEECFGHKG